MAFDVSLAESYPICFKNIGYGFIMYMGNVAAIISPYLN